MDFAKQGAAALAASDAEKAVEVYTQALIEHPTSPDYYTQRSIAFTRLSPPRHDLALQDAEYAVLCGQKRGKRDKIQAAQQRRVVSYYNMGQYADAMFVLDKMQQWRPKDSKPQKMEHDMWTMKINGKLANSSQEGSVAEYPTVSLPDEKTLRKQLQQQLKKDGKFNYDGEKTEVDSNDTAPTSEPPSKSQPQDTPNNVVQTQVVPQKVRHEWYQNNQSVIVTIYAKGVKKDLAEVDIEDDSISVTFPHPADPSSSFNLTFDPLFALIDASKSKFQVMSTKVELTLAKLVQGQKWANIEGTIPLKKAADEAHSPDLAKAAVMSNIQQAPAASSISQPAVGPAYPTSSKNGPKNWDKLANDMTAKKSTKSKKGIEKSKDDSDSGEAEDDDYDSETGGDAVDGFFKKLYAGADPDTRRAMMKSFQESNGTSLSTNWADVGSRHIDEVKSKDES